MVPTQKQSFGDKQAGTGESSNSFEVEVDEEEENEHHPNCTNWCISVPLLSIALVGAAASAAFLIVGVQSAYRDQQLKFHRHASELVAAVQYKEAGIGVQSSRIRGARRGSLNKNMIR